MNLRIALPSIITHVSVASIVILETDINDTSTTVLRGGAKRQAEHYRHLHGGPAELEATLIGGIPAAAEIVLRS